MKAKASDQELYERALRAFIRRKGDSMNQPSASLSGVETLDGRTYVVLRNTNHTLAVYKVEGDGSLRYQENYPEKLGEQP